MTYEEYIQEPEQNPHKDFFTTKMNDGYYVECNVINCKFKDGPYDSEDNAIISGGEHAECYIM